MPSAEAKRQMKTGGHRVVEKYLSKWSDEILSLLRIVAAFMFI